MIVIVNRVEREAEKNWDKILDLIKNGPSLPIVCLGKGEIASELVREWPERTLVVDQDFSSYFIDAFGIYHEVWGVSYAPVGGERLIADFCEVQFKRESLAALFTPTLFLLEKEAGLRLLEQAANWIAKDGIIVIFVPTLNDIRFKNLRSFGKLLSGAELKGYEFQEITPGSFKVTPPLPCHEGCAHEYFSFCSSQEIRQRFLGFKEHIIYESSEKEGFTILLYVVQKS